MQQFQHRSELPADASAVLAAVTTEEYLLYRYEDPELHHLHIEINKNDEQGFACVVSRRGSTNKLPGFARRVVGDAVTMVQEQSWHGHVPPVKGELRIHLEGLPGKITVDLTLRDIAPGRSALEATGHVEVGIPLIGGRLEKMLVGKAEEAFEKSAIAIREYVAEHCPQD